jgi:hypothetical protein
LAHSERGRTFRERCLTMVLHHQSIE